MPSREEKQDLKIKSKSQKSCDSLCEVIIISKREECGSDDVCERDREREPERGVKSERARERAIERERERKRERER